MVKAAIVFVSRFYFYCWFSAVLIVVCAVKFRDIKKFPFRITLSLLRRNVPFVSGREKVADRRKKKFFFKAAIKLERRFERIAKPGPEIFPKLCFYVRNLPRQGDSVFFLCTFAIVWKFVRICSIFFEIQRRRKISILACSTFLLQLLVIFFVSVFITYKRRIWILNYSTAIELFHEEKIVSLKW